MAENKKPHREWGFFVCGQAKFLWFLLTINQSFIDAALTTGFDFIEPDGLLGNIAGGSAAREFH
jgi:hypothetical protein